MKARVKPARRKPAHQSAQSPRAAQPRAAAGAQLSGPGAPDGPRDFLFEIGTEELPPKALSALGEALVGSIGAGLDKAGLAHGELVGFATPRRLAVWV
jgi:hypothetical protein